METNDPQLGTPAEDDPTPAEDTAKADAAKVNAGPTRYAVYDTAELRFRGKVHDTKGDANKAKTELGKPKGVPAGRFEVREV